jgi:hypothetical protein
MEDGTACAKVNNVGFNVSHHAPRTKKLMPWHRDQALIQQHCLLSEKECQKFIAETREHLLHVACLPLFQREKRYVFGTLVSVSAYGATARIVRSERLVHFQWGTQEPSPRVVKRFLRVAPNETYFSRHGLFYGPVCLLSRWRACAAQVSSIKAQLSAVPASQVCFQTVHPWTGHAAAQWLNISAAQSSYSWEAGEFMVTRSRLEAVPAKKVIGRIQRYRILSLVFPSGPGLLTDLFGQLIFGYALL